MCNRIHLPTTPILWGKNMKYEGMDLVSQVEMWLTINKVSNSANFSSEERLFFIAGDSNSRNRTIESYAFFTCYWWDDTERQWLWVRCHRTRTSRRFLQGIQWRFFGLSRRVHVHTEDTKKTDEDGTSSQSSGHCGMKVGLEIPISWSPCNLRSPWENWNYLHLRAKHFFWRECNRHNDRRSIQRFSFGASASEDVAYEGNVGKHSGLREWRMEINWVVALRSTRLTRFSQAIQRYF